MTAHTLSISDDDICSECLHLDYNPGNLSSCALQDENDKWPAEFDTNGYAIDCNLRVLLPTPMGQRDSTCNSAE